jgi:yecA family protein
MAAGDLGWRGTGVPDKVEMRTVIGTIMRRYDEIAACLSSDRDDFEPIFWEGPEGEVIASDWAGGFLDAVALRPQAWKPLIEDHRAGILMAPLFLLNGDMEITDDAADENDVVGRGRRDDYDLHCRYPRVLAGLSEAGLSPRLSRRGDRLATIHVGTSVGSEKSVPEEVNHCEIAVRV